MFSSYKQKQEIKLNKGKHKFSFPLSLQFLAQVARLKMLHILFHSAARLGVIQGRYQVGIGSVRKGHNNLNDNFSVLFSRFLLVFLSVFLFFFIDD